jgi:hypothetical protein
MICDVAKDKQDAEIIHVGKLLDPSVDIIWMKSMVSNACGDEISPASPRSDLREKEDARRGSYLVIWNDVAPFIWHIANMIQDGIPFLFWTIRL